MKSATNAQSLGEFLVVSSAVAMVASKSVRGGVTKIMYISQRQRNLRERKLVMYIMRLFIERTRFWYGGALGKRHVWA
jgi:hypothetical protein